jgi:hypothetical protein
VRDQHRVQSEHTRNLCETWLRCALLRVSRLTSPGDVGSSSVSSSSVSDYPQNLLDAALFTMDDLGVGIPSNILESVASSFLALHMIAPTPYVVHSDSSNIDSRPSGIEAPAHVVANSKRGDEQALSIKVHSPLVSAPAKKAEAPVIRSLSPYVSTCA